MVAAYYEAVYFADTKNGLHGEKQKTRLRAFAIHGKKETIKKAKKNNQGSNSGHDKREGGTGTLTRMRKETTKGAQGKPDASKHQQY